MSEDPVLKLVGSHPPAFSLSQARQISEEHFGIGGKLEPLWGETDQNFKITDDKHSGYVLKISNAEVEVSAIDCQISAMRHLATSAPSLSVPLIKPLLSGQVFGRVAAQDGVEHLIHMVTLLDGVTLANVAIDHDNLFAVGAQAGAVTVGLRGFFHAAAGLELYWDLRRLANYERYIPGIADAGIRKAVEAIVPSFRTDILPLLGTLRSQVIHHDTNQKNALVNPANPVEVTGLVDFSDLIHGPIVQDVAVAAAELARGDDRILDDISAVVRGYDNICPLEEVEIDLIYDLALARLALGVLIGVTRTQNEIGSTGDADYADIYSPSLESLCSVGREKTVRQLRSACRFPEYCPPAAMPPGTNQAATNILIRRRRKVLGTALPLSYDTPVHTVRGRGVWLYDVDGRRYLDCYNNVPHVGHAHPHVVKALSRQAHALNTNSRYLFASVIEYAERIGAMMPGELGACLFVNSGSEANDIALRMARECSSQDGTLIVDGAYHGITNEIYALSPAAEWGLDNGEGIEHVSKLRADIEIVESPDTVRGRFGSDDPQAGEKYAADADRAIATLEQAGHPVGAFMLDSAFSTNGILNVPRGYVEGIAARVRAAGGMIIGDEVQYGFGRSGDYMWGFQNHGLVPDFVTLGKPIGNGLALGLVVTTPEILEQFTRSKEFFSTFGGNPVACAAAMAVLDVIENENLLENSRVTGTYLRDGLRAVGQDNSSVGEVRGKGLFIGVDVVSDPDTMTPDAAQASRIKNHLRDSGLLVGTEGVGGNILKIRPPLVFQHEHADMLIEAFEKALKQCGRP